MPKRNSSNLTVLNNAQLAFLKAFIETGDHELAARISHPAAGDFQKKGSALRNHPVISREIERARAIVTDKIAMGQAEILAELTYIATFDPGCLFHANGEPKKITELTESERRGMVDHDIVFGKNGTITLLGAKGGKMDALKTLAKHCVPVQREKSGERNVFHLDVRFAGPPVREMKTVKGKKKRAARVIDISMELPARGNRSADEESE